MENDVRKILAREYLSKTVCTLCNEPDGTTSWKATSEIHDKVLYDGMDWIDEVVEAVVFSPDSQEAIQQAMTITLQYLVDNVYKNGFNGLVEYREYQKRLDDGKIKSNQDS